MRVVPGEGGSTGVLLTLAAFRTSWQGSQMTQGSHLQDGGWVM
jgi:hypothetical protein